MWFLAIRHLLSRKRQTVLTLMGIALGTAGYVAISGMMLGFQAFIIDQLVNNDAHVRVSAREEIIEPNSLNEEFFSEFKHVFWVAPPSGRRDNSFLEHPQGWFDRFDQDPRVLVYSPQLSLQIIANRAKVSTAARLIGADPTKQIKVSNIEKYMLQGSFADIGQSGNRVVIGDGLLGKLGAQVSESIFISAGKSAPVPFKVVGSFHLGIKTLDDSTIFGALGDVQKVNRSPSRVSDIALRLVNVEDAANIAATWNMIGQDRVQSWDQANEGIMSVFTTQDIVRNAMTLSILIVAGFGIYNILSMAVYQRRREIAILRSIGFEPGDIVRLFLAQGWILGALGGVVGLIVGFFICQYMTTIQISKDRVIGAGTMLVSFDYLIYVRGFLLAFGSSLVASFLPARAAGKMTPIDIIRSEGT